MKKFENDIYTMNIHDDLFLEFIVRKDATLKESDVWLSKQQAEEAYPGKKFYVLLGGEEFFQVTKETREAVASQKFSTHLAAVALFSNELAMKILGNLYIKINRPEVPTKFFTDKNNAELWLRSFMKWKQWIT